MIAKFKVIKATFLLDCTFRLQLRCFPLGVSTDFSSFYVSPVLSYKIHYLLQSKPLSSLTLITRIENTMRPMSTKIQLFASFKLDSDI